jgi:hypothetical protein
MATVTSIKMPTTLVPNRTASLSAIRFKFDPAAISSGYPASGDIIELFEIQPQVRIVGGLIRSTAVGAASSTLTVQAKQGGTTTNLNGTALAATAVGSAPIDRLAPSYSANTVVQILVNTAALNASGEIEVIVLTDPP